MKINYAKIKSAEDRALRFLNYLMQERLQVIAKRVKAIRDLKTFKEKTNSNFLMTDYNGYLIELHQLNSDYNHILGFYDDGFNLLTSSEVEAIKALKENQKNQG